MLYIFLALSQVRIFVDAQIGWRWMGIRAVAVLERDEEKYKGFQKPRSLMRNEASHLISFFEGYWGDVVINNQAMASISPLTSTKASTKSHTQELVFLSGIHITDTQWSTFCLLSAEWPCFSLSFFLLFPLGLRDTNCCCWHPKCSDGRKGRTCKKVTDVVCKTLKKSRSSWNWSRTNNWVLIPLISEFQSSLSSSVTEWLSIRKHTTSGSYQHSTQHCLRNSNTSYFLSESSPRANNHLEINKFNLSIVDEFIVIQPVFLHNDSAITDAAPAPTLIPIPRITFNGWNKSQGTIVEKRKFMLRRSQDLFQRDTRTQACIGYDQDWYSSLQSWQWKCLRARECVSRER